MGAGRVVVVGLGPGGADLLVPAAPAPWKARRAASCARDVIKPSLIAADGLELETFDDRYDAADDLESVYSGIVEALIAAASEGDVAYAVPGNPAVAERTVELLHDAARAGRIELTVVPGLSFADAAWSRLGVDPMAISARVVDARAFDAHTQGLGTSGLLIAQCDSRLVLSDVKLHLLERLAPDTPVVVLQRLGLADEHVAELALSDLDRTIEPDHLTAVWVPPTNQEASTALSAPEELARLLELAVTLRARAVARGTPSRRTTR